MGVLKKSASGVLPALSCSRTPVYAPRANLAAALLDGPFLNTPFIALDCRAMVPGRESDESFNYSTVS
jgi:hypothetical protein